MCRHEPHRTEPWAASSCALVTWNAVLQSGQRVIWLLCMPSFGFCPVWELLIRSEKRDHHNLIASWLICSGRRAVKTGPILAPAHKQRLLNQRLIDLQDIGRLGAQDA